MICERLDRFYASEKWLHTFPDATTLNFPILVSDHSPMLLYTSPEKRRKKGTIEMEAWCFDLKEAKELVHNQWTREVLGSPTYKVAQKCSHTRFKLFKWSKAYKA